LEKSDISWKNPNFPFSISEYIPTKNIRYIAVMVMVGVMHYKEGNSLTILVIVGTSGGFTMNRRKYLNLAVYGHIPVDA
jgi:hypothetical protein